MINGKLTDEVRKEPPTAQPAAPAPAEPATEEAPNQPGVALVASPAPPRWRMPSPPKSLVTREKLVTREQVDAFGRAAAMVGASLVRFVASMARGLGRLIGWGWHTVEQAPPAVRLLFIVGVLTLVSIAGSVALDDSLGLTCAVVFVPLCAVTLGAIGHRWYSGLNAELARREADQAASHATSELKRSVLYLDNKLAFALNSLDTDQHQQAVIALFQAKTAIELALGTEQPATASQPEGLPAIADHNNRPRIQAASASTSLLRENNSQVAS